MSVVSEFDTYTFDVFGDCARVYAFGECVSKVVVCTYLTYLNYTT